MAEDILVGHLDRESSLRSNAVHCCLYINLVVMVMMIIVTSDESTVVFISTALR